MSQPEPAASQKGERDSQIVWLASYPRSGNTLSRHVLHDSLGLPSISEDNFPPISLDSDSADSSSFQEVVPKGTTWPQYVRAAESGTALHIVKTHLLPQDNRRAIYVIRDGRKAVWSYRCFCRDFAHSGRSLEEILLGADPYGTWANHVKTWSERPPGSTFFIRYEELVDIRHERLLELAEFLYPGQTREVKPWENTFSTLQASQPQFYREGKKDWTPPAEWTPGIDEIFRAIHGSMMESLGYWAAGESATTFSPEMRSLLQLASREAMLCRGGANLGIFQQYESRVLHLKEKRVADAVKIARLKARLQTRTAPNRPWYRRILRGK